MASSSSFIQNLSFKVDSSQADSNIKRLTASLQSYSSQVNKATGSSNKQNQALQKLSDQGIFNIQAGLVQLSTYSMILNQKINNLFDTMGNSYRKAETSITQLKIKLGDVAGEPDPEGKIRHQSEQAQKEIARIAATTMFTVPEVAGAFNELSTTINGYENQLAALGPTLRYVAASAGKVSLEEGVKTASLATTVLGAKVEQLPKFFDDVIVASRRTSGGIENMKDMIIGTKSALGAFNEEAKDNAHVLMVLGASMSATGKEGRDGGDSINQFATSLSNLSKLAARGSFRGYGRKSVGHKNLLQLFGLVDNSGRILDATPEFEKFVNDNFKNGRRVLRRFKGKKGKLYTDHTKSAGLMDSFITSQLFDKDKHGTLVTKSAKEAMKTIFTRFQKVKEGEDQGRVINIMKGAFMSKSAFNVLNTLEKQIMKTLNLSGKLSQYIGKEKEFKNYQEIFEKFIDATTSKGGEAAKAQSESLKTLQGKTYLLESAYDALYQTLMKQDIYGKDALDIHKQVVGVMDDVIKRSPDLGSAILVFGRSAQMFTGFATNAGFALTAVATFSMALTHSTKVTGRSVTTLGGLLGSFRTIFLAPAFRVLTLLGGGFAVAGLAMAGFMRHFTPGQTSFIDVFKGKLQSLKDTLIRVRGLIALDSKQGGKVGNNIKKIQDQIKEEKRLIEVKDKALLASLKKGADDAPYIEAANNLKEFQKQAQKLKSIVGIEAYDSIAKMDPNETKNITETTNTVRKLKKSFMGFANAFATTFDPIVGGIMFVIEGVGKLLSWPIKLINLIFGLTSGGNFMGEWLGYFVGAVLGIKLVIASITFFWGTLRGMATSLANNTNTYVTNLHKTLGLQNQILAKTQVKSNYTRGQIFTNQRQNYQLNAQFNWLQKLQLEYLAITGQNEKLVMLQDRYNSKLLQREAILKKQGLGTTMGGNVPVEMATANKLAKGGVIASTVLMAATMIPGLSESTQNWIGGLSTVLMLGTMIGPMLAGFIPTITAIGIVLVPILIKFALIAAAIGGAVWLLNKMLGTSEAVNGPKKVNSSKNRINSASKGKQVIYHDHSSTTKQFTVGSRDEAVAIDKQLTETQDIATSQKLEKLGQ